MKLQRKLFVAIAVLATTLVAPVAFGQDNVKSDLVEAATLYKSGDLKSALDKMIALEQKAPDNPEVLSWLGFLYIRNGEPDKAVAPLEKAHTINPDDLEVMNNLGNAYVTSGMDSKALGIYTKLAELDPKMYESWYNIGGIHLRKKDFPKAIASFEKAVSIRNNDAFAHNNLGSAYEGNKNLGKAAECYEVASNLRPDESLFARNAGFAYLRLKNDAKAIPMLERAHKSGREVDLNVVSALAQAAARKKDHTKALNYMTQLESKMGSSSDYWYNLGVLKAAIGDKAGAEAAYRKSLDLNPNDVDAMNNLGLMLFKRGDFDGALPIFEKLYGTSPNSVSAMVNYASCLSQTGDLKAAAAIWRKILQVEPKRHDVRLDLASALWQMKDKEGSRAQYAMVLASRPNDVQALNGLGLYYFAADELAKAELNFRNAIKVDRNFLPPYNNLAVTLERMNKRTEAMKVLASALAIDANYAEAAKNLQRMKAAQARG